LTILRFVPRDESEIVTGATMEFLICGKPDDGVGIVEVLDELGNDLFVRLIGAEADGPGSNERRLAIDLAEVARAAGASRDGSDEQQNPAVRERFPERQFALPWQAFGRISGRRLPCG
jgi:hypothetical protein